MLMGHAARCKVFVINDNCDRALIGQSFVSARAEEVADGLRDA